MICAGGVARHALTAALLIVGAGCSLASGVEVARPSSGAATPRWGPAFEASLSLPRTYRFVAGAEWMRPGTPADLWRAGGYLGYRQPPEADRRWGWEGTARAGLLRGWERGMTTAGAYGGVRFGLLMRLGAIAEPQDDSLLEAIPSLVADVGVNGLLPARQSLQPEASARLLLRISIGSALIP